MARASYVSNQAKIKVIGLGGGGSNAVTRMVRENIQGVDFIAMNTDKALVNRQGWNTMVVRAEGDRLQIWLNNKQIANVRDQTSDSGRIGFQVHRGDVFKSMKIVVREVLIKSKL